MRPDLYTQPPMKPGFGHGGAWSSGPSKLFKLLVLLAVVGGLGTAGWKKWGPSAVVAGPRGKWLHDLDEGLAAGAASGKPVLVLYTADWCPPCRGLQRPQDQRVPGARVCPGQNRPHRPSWPQQQAGRQAADQGHTDNGRLQPPRSGNPTDQGRRGGCFLDPPESLALIWARGVYAEADLAGTGCSSSSAPGGATAASTSFCFCDG
ncbi:MAG: thioredoxin family protein [Planctomycetota bacterium]